MTNLLTRRNLLKLGVAGTVVLGLEGLALLSFKDTVANQSLDAFPTEIPGAERVEKYKITGADKTLVHIKQIHLVENIKENSPEWEEIVHVQSEIYQILDSLNLNYGLKTVYDEGVSPELMELVEGNRTLKRMRSGLEDITLDFCSRRLLELEELKRDPTQLSLSAYLRYPDDKNCLQRYSLEIDDEISSLKEDIDEIKRMVEENKIIYGAALKMFDEGRIQILPAETLRANLLASVIADDVLSGKPVSEKFYDEYVMKNREDLVLSFISESADPINFLVYGGGHWFGDNINQWNKKHPDKKYSLIEIVHRSYNLD